MGVEYKQNFKRLQGRPNVVGQDVFEFSGTIPDASGTANLYVDQRDITTHRCVASGEMAFAAFQMEEALNAGAAVIPIIRKNGSVVASGLITAGQQYYQWLFRDGVGKPTVTVAQNDTIGVTFQVGGTVLNSNGDSNADCHARVGVTYYM